MPQFRDKVDTDTSPNLHNIKPLSLLKLDAKHKLATTTINFKFPSFFWFLKVNSLNTGRMYLIAIL